MESEYGQQYADLYNRHWWWRARERILVRELRSLSLPKQARVLDVGCGDGLFFARLREFGTVEGIETNRSLVTPSNPDRDLIHPEPLGSARYQRSAFDLITACDVIEHIEDDREAVTKMLEMLAPSGYLVITVPAFMSLWDEHDELNQHFRRYTKQSLLAALPKEASVRKLHYLFHTLFVPKLLVRLLNRRAGQKVKQSDIPPEQINQVLAGFCDLENRLLGALQLPFGTSVLAVIQKAASVTPADAASLDQQNPARV